MAISKKKVRVEPQPVISNLDSLDLADINFVKYGAECTEEEEAQNILVFRSHWFYSKLYVTVAISMFLLKLFAAFSFFHSNPFEEMTDFQRSSQKFGFWLLIWSFNIYYLLPYFGDENNTKEEKDQKTSSIFIIGSALNILGTVVFGIYSHEYNAPGQIFDYIGLGEFKTLRTLGIALTVLVDLLFGFMFGNCELMTFDPRAGNDKYKLTSFTRFVRDDSYMKTRLDIEQSTCFRILIRNRGRTAIKFGDPQCVDPTFRSVTSFKIERCVTKFKRFFYFIKWRKTQAIEFTVRIMKTIPPGDAILFIPEPHNAKGAFRIKGLRSFCVDRGDIVETKMTLPYDRHAFLTRIEYYSKSTARADKYEQPQQIEESTPQEN